MKIYFNYLMEDGGLSKIKTNPDKYTRLLTGEDANIRIYYRPEKRSVIKRSHTMQYLKHTFYDGVLRHNQYLTKIQAHIATIYNHMFDSMGDKKPVFKSYKIEQFLEKYYKLKDNFDLDDKSALYNEWPIPKRKLKDGKIQYRHIASPIKELKELQEEAKEILEDIFKLHPHNAVHSYTKKRDNVTNGKMHRYSKHIIKMDLKDFFPSLTPEFIKERLCSFKEFAIVNISTDYMWGSEHEVSRLKEIKALTNTLLDAIINIATYKKGLPQGSPLSPLLSNLVLFEEDHNIEKGTSDRDQDFSKTLVMYTRYADDLTFSSTNPINKIKLEQFIKTTIEQNTPCKVNLDKTKYLKNTHRCYITGVKVNKDNKVTYGHEKKAELKRDLFHLFMLYTEGNADVEQARETLGQLAYLQKIEPAYARKLIKKYAKQFSVPVSHFYKHFLD